MESLLSELQQIKATGDSPLYNNEQNTPQNQKPPPTPEEVEKILGFLSQLEELKVKDPEAYIQTIAALGIPNDDENTENTNGDSNLSPLSQLTESVKMLRAGGNIPNSLNNVQLPNGKSVLGSNGVENKV